MSYYTLKDRVKNIIERHNSHFSESEKYIIKALIKWLEGDTIDPALLDIFYQIAEFRPSNVPDEDKIAIIRLILSACSL